MTEVITREALAALLQVVMIDLVLAGDNAVVIALAAAGLAPELRKRAIIIGIVAATVLRIILATLATQLLQVLGLLLAGGILLLWVCWKMWRELRMASQEHEETDERVVDCAPSHDSPSTGRLRRKSFSQAALQIVVADISMSLANVLAVAGAAREHPFVLVFGLLLSVTLMGIGANLLARLLQKHAPLDGLCRASRHSLCGLRNDLSWRPPAKAGDWGHRTDLFMNDDDAEAQHNAQGSGISGKMNETRGRNNKIIFLEQSSLFRG